MPVQKIIVLAAAAVAAALLVGCSFMHQTKFGRNPTGQRLARVQKSKNYADGAFRNETGTRMMTGRKTQLATMLEFVFKDRDKRTPKLPVTAVRTNLRELPSDQDLMIWFGHSSYLFQLSGRRILVDPVFYDASPVSFSNPAYPGTDIYKPQDMPDIDVLVISHDHWDHLDYRTVTELKDRIGKVVVPLGVGEHFEFWGYPPDKIVELDWHETGTAAGLTFHCLPARHFSGRGLKRNQTLWASFLVEAPGDAHSAHSGHKQAGASGDYREGEPASDSKEKYRGSQKAVKRIYIGGDSGYGPHFRNIGTAFSEGGIDLAILENGQYNDAWSEIHTLPRFLDLEVKELGAQRFITVHHSKFCLSLHPWDEPLNNELKAAEKSGVPLSVLVIGRPVSLFDGEIFEEKKTDDESMK